MYIKNLLSEEFVNVFDIILNEEEKNLKSMGLRDLSLREIHFLSRVKYCNDNGLIAEPKELQRQLNVTKGTLSISSKRLIEKGYLSKQTDPEDKRKIFFELKEKSFPALEKHSLWHKKLVDIASKDLTEDEVEQVVKILEKIRNSVLNEKW